MSLMTTAFKMYSATGIFPTYILTIPVKYEFTPLQIIEVRRIK